MSDRKTNPDTEVEESVLDATADALVGTHEDVPDGDLEGDKDTPRPPIKSP